MVLPILDAVAAGGSVPTAASAAAQQIRSAVAQRQENDELVLSQEGQALLAEALAAHAYIAGAIVQGRPDLALAEAQKWTEGFADAARIVREQEAAGKAGAS